MARLRLELPRELGEPRVVTVGFLHFLHRLCDLRSKVFTRFVPGFSMNKAQGTSRI
jgi:hypothetical protein